MALIDKASLLMVPSTYEDGTLYNVLPSGNKAPDETGNNNGYDQTRADFSFSRGSNLSATRIGSDGLIEKGRENLLTESNNFSDSDWVKADTSVTSGQADKDGGTNAWLLAITGANGFQTLRQTKSVSGVNTISIYAKANALNWMRIINGVSNTYFDIANGVVGTDSSIGASIESAGNGFFRCSIPFSGAGSYVYIYPATGDGNVTQSSGSIYIQSAQLEAGLVATDYIETGATTATAGVLENTPRIDYSSGAGALLLEPQRTNSAQSSEYIVRNVLGWDINSDNSITTENNSTTSPEGLQNAVKLIFDGSGYSYARTSLTSGASTLSVYVKKGNWRYIGLRNSDNASTHSVFDFDTESFVRVQTGHSCDFENVGNGWYRIWDYQSTSVSPANGLRGVAMCDANGTEYNPTTPADSYNYIWGFQVELGASYPSSYVPTYGSAATRGVDSCSVTGVSDVIGQTEGTLFVEFMTPETNSYFIHSVSDGTNNNKVQIEYNTTSDTLIGIVRVSGVTEVSISATGMTPNTRYKAAIAYKANDFVFYVNGTQKGTDTSGSVPSSMSVIHLGSQVGTFFESGEVYNATLFNERLSNTELATLTTL